MRNITNEASPKVDLEKSMAKGCPQAQAMLLISSSFIDFYNIFYPKKADGFVWKFGFF
jgi:hypothetical protein